MSEGLVQGPYVAARGGVEPATFHTKGTEQAISLLSYIGCIMY